MGTCPHRGTRADPRGWRGNGNAGPPRGSGWPAGSPGLFAAALAAIWFIVLFAYGMVWGSLGGVGDAAAGMRSVRISDGTTSGAWLGGWRAVCWSFAPLYLVMAVAVAFSGGGGDSFSANFVSIDRRSGVAGGAAPVPDPQAAAEKQAPVSQVTRLD